MKNENGEDDFLSQLENIDREKSLPVDEYFQRACLRSLVSYYVHEKHRTPSPNDTLVINYAGIGVLSSAEMPTDELSKSIQIRFSEKAIAKDLLNDDTTNDGILLRRCIVLSWNICKYIAWSLSEAEYLELCRFFKDSAEDISSTTNAQHFYSEFGKRLSDAPIIPDAVMETDRAKQQKYLSQYVRFGCLRFVLILAVFAVIIYFVLAQ